MYHSPKRHNEHKHHRDNNKPNRTSAPPKVKRDHEERQSGEQLVRRAEEGPKYESALAGVGDALVGSARRHGGHGGGDHHGEDRCDVFVLQQGNREKDLQLETLAQKLQQKAATLMDVNI